MRVREQTWSVLECSVVSDNCVFMRLTRRTFGMPRLKHTLAQPQLQLQPPCDLVLFCPTSRGLTGHQQPSVEGLVSALWAIPLASVGVAASYCCLWAAHFPRLRMH